MSDSSVIDNFVGDYESDGNTTGVTERTRHYYPAKGVKLALDKVELEGVPGGAYAKIRIKPDGQPFSAKLQLERAVFRVRKGQLVAEDIEVQPMELMDETLTMNAVGGKKEMTHTLTFEDGTLGTWICKT